MTRDPGAEKRVAILRVDGPTSVFVDAVVAEDGTLSLEGHDLGAAPREHFGHDDYEYATIVSPAHKDDVLLALMKERFGATGTPSSDFEDWLREHQIPFQIFRWP